MKKICLLLLPLLPMACSEKIVRSQTGLQYRILEKGSGMEARPGDQVFIHETTRYRNGTILYSNYDPAVPVKILLGGNQATQAVDEGIRGMKIGEVRELTAPPELVRRKSYPANVSPDSTLIIKIKLAKIERKTNP